MGYASDAYFFTLIVKPYGFINKGEIIMIRGYITNLGKYNEGQLLGKWIEFPVLDSELYEILEEIGINDDYEEYFFTDWETDWDIEPQKEFGEYPDIDEVNDIVDEMYDIEDDGNLDWLYAYIEYSGANLYDAVMKYQDNSIFYGNDTYEIVENFLCDCYGVEDRLLSSILNYMNCDDFVSYELNIYSSDYGYIECF